MIYIYMSFGMLYPVVWSMLTDSSGLLNASVIIALIKACPFTFLSQKTLTVKVFRP
jgi:hypothetical protein